MVNSIHSGIFPIYHSPNRGSDRMSVTISAIPTTKVAVNKPAKKLNKWDAIMSKISEPSSKPLVNVKEVKSRFAQSIMNPTLSKLQKEQHQRLSENIKPKNNRVQTNNQRNVHVGSVGSGRRGVISGSRHLIIDHSDQDGYSVQSSTESESSLQDQSSGPSSTTTVSRMKRASLSRNRQSDSSSTSDISSARARQRKVTNGASKLTLTSTSNTTLCSTNPTSMTSGKMTGKIKASSVQSLHNGTRNVTSRLLDSSKPCRDRNRMGPDGKLAGGTDSSSQLQTNNTNSQHQNGGSNNSSIKSNQPLVNNAAISSYVNLDGNNHHNNNNNNAPSSPCNNNATLTVENSRLKEQLNLQFELSADLKTKLEEANNNANNTKHLMEAELKLLSQKFLAMMIVAQKFNEQRSIIDEKLRQEKNLAQKRENQLASERAEEIQNLRVEFERERECVAEERLKMTRTDESQVEKIKELEAELSKKEQLLCTKTQEYEDQNEQLKRKHKEEVEAIKDKYKQEAQDELIKSQVLKRTLSSPQSTNSTNEVLQKEIHSLQVVIEMRNKEIKTLRQELLTQQSVLEDLGTCKEQNKGLLAKVEDLNAQLAKTRQDKHDMQEKYQASEKAAGQSLHQLNQIQLENEQLKWRLATIRTDERVSEIMSKSAVQLGCDAHLNLDYETAMSSLLDKKLPSKNGLNGCVQ